MDMLRLRLFSLAAMSCLSSQVQFTFIEPILAPRLTDFDLDEAQIGLFFVIMPVFYILSCVIMSNIPERVNKHAIMIIGFWLMGFGCLFVGPSKLLHLPDNLVTMGFGQAFNGMFYPVCLIPSLPAMIEEVEKRYPSQKDTIENTVSGLFNSFIGLGMLIGPLMGSALTKEYGF